MCDRSQGQKTFRPACGVFCEEQDGPNVKSYGHSLGTEKVWFLYACGNAALVHRNEQTSTCIPPKCICMVFHLEKETQKQGFKTKTQQLNIWQIYPLALSNFSSNLSEYLNAYSKSLQTALGCRVLCARNCVVEVKRSKNCFLPQLIFVLSLCSSLCHISTCFVSSSPEAWRFRHLFKYFQNQDLIRYISWGKGLVLPFSTAGRNLLTS